MSCSRAAISSRSRWLLLQAQLRAQAEQVRATRRLCPAVAACLHCKAANRLLGDSQPQLDQPRFGRLARQRRRLPAGSRHVLQFFQQRSQFGDPMLHGHRRRDGAVFPGRRCFQRMACRSWEGILCGQNRAFSLSNLGHAETCVKIGVLRTADLETVSNEPIFWSHIPLGRGLVRVSAVHRVVSCLYIRGYESARVSEARTRRKRRAKCRLRREGA